MPECDYGPTEWFADFHVLQPAQGIGNRKRLCMSEELIGIEQSHPVLEYTQLSQLGIDCHCLPGKTLGHWMKPKLYRVSLSTIFTANSRRIVLSVGDRFTPTLGPCSEYQIFLFIFYQNRIIPGRLILCILSVIPRPPIRLFLLEPLAILVPLY